MRRIPDAIRKAIIQRLLAGDSYRKIQREFNVSLATINQIKEEAKDWIPDIESLKELSILLKKRNVNFFDTARGAKLLDKLNSFGINLDDLDKYIKLVEKMLPKKIRQRQEFGAAAIRLMELEEKSEKTYPELLEDFQKKSSQITQLENRIKSLKGEERQRKNQISELGIQVGELNNKISALNDRKSDLLDDICNKECISRALNEHKFEISCRLCGRLITVQLPTKEEITRLVENKGALSLY